jgi:enolase
MKKFNFIPRQILDSRGNPTIEIICKLNYKIIARGSSPSGASCGTNEAFEIRDNITELFNGKSILKTFNIVNDLNKQIIFSETSSLKNIDEQLIKLDNTKNKNNLGGNTTTAFSFCILDLITNINNIEKYEYIKKISNNNDNLFIPTPMANILNGGKHGSGGLKIQEFMIYPNTKFDITKQIQLIYEVTLQLKKCLINKYGKISVNFGDEGGFVPCGINTNYEAIDIIIEAINNSKLIPNDDIFIALDCAASEFYDKKTKLYEIEDNLKLNGDELIKYYSDMINKYPLIKSIEDPFDENDYLYWIKFNKLFKNKINIVGDDLFCSNSNLIIQGLDNEWANSLLLKVNQIGTITESIDSAKLMLKLNKIVIVSHRSGETNQNFIIDLAVGLGAQFVKIGGLCRGERISKYNRLLEINDLLLNN